MLYWIVMFLLFQEKKAKENTDYELSAALARHGHHLAQMLRLQQEEHEHQSAYRRREDLAEQNAAFEAKLLRWTRRMEAIEHVVDGRADIDRVAKETQALWLAVESLAFALEVPFARIGASGALESEMLKPFHTSEPLARFAEAIQDAAGERHDFAKDVVSSMPRQALSDGVWTRQGLLHRFHKVRRRLLSLVLKCHYCQHLRSSISVDSPSQRYLS